MAAGTNLVFMRLFFAELGFLVCTQHNRLTVQCWCKHKYWCQISEICFQLHIPPEIDKTPSLRIHATNMIYYSSLPPYLPAGSKRVSRKGAEVSIMSSLILTDYSSTL